MSEGGSVVDRTGSTTENATPQPVVFHAEETVLSNGLRLITLEDHGAPVVSYQVHYAAGSRNERPGITGISHLFEHMMFKGTPSLGPEEFAKTIQAHGGQLNAFTTEDNTSYYENLPSHCLEIAIRWEADRQANLLLTEANLKSEREVVRNERLLRTVNTPYGLAKELFTSLAYQRHPYSWPVVGWDTDLIALTLDDCKQYFETYYAPNNTTVVVAGDFDTKDIRHLVEAAYGSMLSGPPPPPVVTFEEPQTGERRAVHHAKLEAAALFAGFHIPQLTHTDIFPLLVLSNILSTGESSRMFQRFVKTGRAGMVHTDVGLSFLNMDPMLFRIEAVTNPGDDPVELEQELWEQIDCLRQDGVTQKEVTRAIKQLSADFVQEAQTCFHRGLLLGLYQVRANDWSFVNRLVSGYRDVKIEDVERAARSYLVESNRTVVTAIPETA